MKERGDTVLGWLKRLTQDNYHERLSEYVDGRLSATETAKVEAQLAASDEARTEVAELRAVADLLHGTPMVEAPRSFALSHAPLPLAHAPRQHRQGLRGLSMATAAAVLALVVVTSADIAGLAGDATDTPTTGAVETAFAPEAGDGTLMDASKQESLFTPAEVQPPVIQEAPSNDLGFVEESTVIDWLRLSLSILAGALGLATLVLFWMPARPLT
jgi:anti-sigma factor RsiW